MRALVLGGGGFIGRHVCDALTAAGHAVTIFDRIVTRFDLPHVVGQMQDRATLAAALRDQDWVFHLVGTTLPKSSNDNPTFDVQSNLVGTLGLLDACVAAGVKRVVFASSGGTVYGVTRADPIPENHATRPICSYGITKLAVEHYLHLYRYLHGLEGVALRVANPYGEGQRLLGEQGAVGHFLKRVRCGEPVVVWGDGQVVRDFVYVRDVAAAFVLAAESPSAAGGVFNVGSGSGTSLNDLVAALRLVTGEDFAVEYLPGRAVDVPRSVLDVQRARDIFGWRPRTPLTEGLARTWAWVQRVMDRDGALAEEPVRKTG
jgi:UDP-glucose 4-epimerase